MTKPEFVVGADASVGVGRGIALEFVRRSARVSLRTRGFGKTGQSRGPSHVDKLRASAPGDWDAHGLFDAHAPARSWQIVASQHRNERRAGAPAVGARAGGLIGKRRSNSPRSTSHP